MFSLALQAGSYLAEIVLCYVNNFLWCSRTLDRRIGKGEDRIALFNVTEAIVDVLRILRGVDGANVAVGCVQRRHQAGYLKWECVSEAMLLLPPFSLPFYSLAAIP